MARTILHVVFLAFVALGSVPAAQADDGVLCRAAISATELSQRIPDAFLAAIARVESGRPDRQTGALAAWPWTINAEGVGSFYATKAEAIDAVKALQARGVRSIDVGCLQVNLLNHPEAFGSLEQAFDPGTNATFAGRFLMSLFDKMGSWPLAAAAYHSQTPNIGAAYQRRVLAEWAVPNQADEAAPPHPRHPGTASPQRGDADPDSGKSSISTRPGGGVQNAEVSPAFGRAGNSAVQIAHSGSVAFTGRSLAAYRLLPTPLALRTPRRSG